MAINIWHTSSCKRMCTVDDTQPSYLNTYVKKESADSQLLDMLVRVQEGPGEKLRIC